MGADALFFSQLAATAISDIHRTKAQSKAARYEAEIQRQQADYYRQLADSEAADLRRKTDRALGQQVARFAAAGVDPSSGSALLVQQALAGDAEIEALRIRNSGYSRAAILDRSAYMSLSQARVSARQSYLGIGTHLLTQIAPRFY